VLILSHLRLPEGVDRLEPMLDDDDPDVRLVAVAGLPLGEDPGAVPALVRALSKRRLAPERVIERQGQPWALENFGYRQWLALVRTRALWTVLRPETGWGEMTRVGFSEPSPAVAQGITSPPSG
jgi:hypothetical protein